MGGPFMPPNYCRCPDNGKESVRTKSGQSKCKKCSKPKTPYVQRGTNGSHQPKSRAKLQLSDTHHSPSPASVARSAGKAWDPARQTRQSFGPKDPYDYIRRTRLKADDWDTYWESSGDPEMTPPSRHSPQRSAYGNNNGNKYIKHSKTSPEARKGQGSDARNMSTPKISDSKIETDGHIKEVSRQNDKRQPLDMRMTVCDLMEDEDSSQPESKPISNLEPSAKSPKLGGQSIQGNAKTSSPTPNPSSSNKDSKNENSSSDGLESENDLSANLLADLVLMKSKISVAEMRYRKFQRRNPLRKLSLQIDEVIMEEDEEALENEDRDYKIYKQSLLTTVLEDELDEEKESSGSDDELGIGKFNHVIGNSNFADEILSEIYGVTGGSQCSDTGKPSEHDSESRQEGGAVEDYTPSRSLADEILDELYGKTIQNNSLYNQPDNEYCNMEDLRIGDGSHNNDNEFCEETTAEGQQDRLKSELLEADGEILSTSENYSIIGYGGRTRLYRSASLQEKGGGLGLSLLLNDTTRFKLSHRPSLLHLLPEDQAILLPNLPGTPTLHRPSRPPPPPPNNTHPLLQPFNSLELSRINNVIRNADTTSNGDDSSGSEFSDDEFDPIDMDYENIPMERPPPEGAEADAEYDVPELNESFEQEPCGSGDLDISCDRIVDLDTSFNSSCIGDISSDSLMLPRVMDTSFDRDSINSVDSHHYQESHISSHNSGSGSVIQNHGEKTIILSPALAQSRALPKGVDQNQSENKLFISSASWINIDGLSENVHSVGVIKSPEIHIVSEENGNCADLSNINMTEQSLEPVKPPRLKKLARQQSKQEMLRAKGFGLSTSIKSNISSQVLNENINSESHKSIKGLNYNPSQLKARPEIGLPILINSTLNSEDLENHKCITLHSSDEPFLLHGGPSSDEAEICSVYRAPSSDTDSSFYMADSVIEEAYNNTGAAATDIYNEHIYEEIPENRHKVRPLPPIPEGALGSALAKSIFTGATKYEILHYLNDAKQRMEGNVVEFDGVNEDNDGSDVNNFLGNRNHKHRVSAISNISDSSNSSNDSSGDGSVLWRGPLDKIVGRVEIERNDSGVGSDSGISSCKIPTGEVSSGCEDCEITLPEDELVCLKCLKRRGERKEIITEIVETEVKYGRDLRIIVEEFYRPMLVAGLLSSDHLASIFLNVEQLIQVNTSFTVKLKEALDQASAAEDEDLCTVKIGSLFIHAMPMLQAFEAYCTKQAASSMLLANMEREKELLRVFLKVSQMENKILRRMNLSSFLMVPVQRVTKYPLLLARLLKVTPAHHGDRDNIREAQARIESALEQINKDAKEIIAMKGSWRRGGQSNKKMGIQREMNNMRVRKLSLEMLGWTREETRFALEGRLTFAHVTDSNWRMKWKGTVNTGMKLVTANALLVVTSKPGNAGFPINNNVNSSTPSPADLHTSTNIIFPKPESIGDAVLLLVREKTSRFSTVRDPFFLEKSIVCCEQDWEYEYFEIHEFGSKDSYVFKADDPNMTGTWFQALQFYSQCLGGWRKRRKGLGNIMVDPGLS
eukprot:TRINITY_DN6063_c0_g1_i1.p1 TRINITY_DN6063_c0_g1~~TRINITY_DN6063_c0_g1_i1.p1  ORF type:complete len:1713 (-),score=279.68 TRINITY_DN6063_c0_g1_i1:339-4958(-)